MNKVFPTSEELQLQRAENVPCEIAGCNKTFKHSLALRFHMVKVHNVIKINSDLKLARKEKTQGNKLEYHCPEKSCHYYYYNSLSKFFASLKLLRQHYKQVHCAKKFNCDSCRSKFSRHSDLRRHQVRCGRNVCETCNIRMQDIESLVQHTSSHNQNKQVSNMTTAGNQIQKVSEKAEIKCRESKLSLRKVKGKHAAITKTRHSIKTILPKPQELYIVQAVPLSFVPNWKWSDPIVKDDSHLTNNSNLISLSNISTPLSAKSQNARDLRYVATQTILGSMCKTVETQTQDVNLKTNKRSQGSQVLLSRKMQLTEQENSHTQTYLGGEPFPSGSVNSCYQEMLNKSALFYDNETQTLEDLYNSSGYFFNNEYVATDSDKNIPAPDHNSDTVKQSDNKEMTDILYCAAFPNNAQMQALKNSTGFSSISQQTNYNELLSYVSCTAGTQTSDLWYCDEMSTELTLSTSLNNIETQTQDVLDFVSEDFIKGLGCIDIETQTNLLWDDLMKGEMQKQGHRLQNLFSDIETQTHY